MGLIGVGSSRDSDVRGVFNVGNSIASAGGLEEGVSGVGLVGSLGTGELSLWKAREVGDLFSAKGSGSGGAVTERLGAARPVITGETFPLSALTMGSETTVGVGLGRVNP